MFHHIWAPIFLMHHYEAGTDLMFSLSPLIARPISYDRSVRWFLACCISTLHGLPQLVVAGVGGTSRGAGGGGWEVDTAISSVGISSR